MVFPLCRGLAYQRERRSLLGVAVGIRTGVPRATLDVDFAVSTKSDRARLSEALVRRNFRPKGTFAHSINFVHESGEPVQLAFDAAFDAAIERAEPVRFGPLELPVVIATISSR